MARPHSYWPFGLAIFFFAAAIMCSLAALTLGWPQSALDWIWRIKPEAHAQLLAYRPWPAIGFAVLAAAMAAASFGMFRRKRWGWALACALFAANGIGDAIEGFAGAYVQGAIGVSVVTALLYALSRPHVRLLFD